MVSNTKEIALEQAIQKHLTGFTSEELAGQPQPDSPSKFRIGLPQDFDAQYALNTKLFWESQEYTQADELDKLRKHSPNDWQRKVLERFDRIIKQKGLLHILKKGLQVDNAFLVLMYPAPLASSSAKVHENFDANLFSVMRQVRYSQANPMQEIDMVLFINGMPLITLELKNAWTGQTARYHGQKQYREDRDPAQPLLQFGRALVHMAVDTDEVFMATKLAGKDTFFLPFNKGHNEGEGAFSGSRRFTGGFNVLGSVSGWFDTAADSGAEPVLSGKRLQLRVFLPLFNHQIQSRHIGKWKFT